MSHTETALAKSEFSLRPQSLAEAIQFAKMVANTDLVPKDYRGKPENALVAMQMGMEIGLPPMQALQSIAVINGRPSLWGDAILALIMRDPSFVDIEETYRDSVATCTIKRRGRTPCTRTFSVADAELAGLWNKRGREGQPTPWVTHPQRMLQMKARAFAARDCFPDVLKGLSVAEEAQDISPVGAVTIAAEAVVKELPAPAVVSPATKTEATKEKLRARMQPSLERVLERIAAAKTEVELQLVAEDAAQLPDGDKAAAKVAYKSRWNELHEMAQAQLPPGHDDLPPFDEQGV